MILSSQLKQVGLRKISENSNCEENKSQSQINPNTRTTTGKEIIIPEFTHVIKCAKKLQMETTMYLLYKWLFPNIVSQ